jgi:hypothetical protein
VAVETPPHVRATLVLGGLSGVPLNDRLITPLSLKPYLYADSDPVMLVDPSGKMAWAERMPITTALVSPAVKAALTQLAIRAATSFVLMAVALGLSDKLQKVFDAVKARLGNRPNFDKCWRETVRDFVIAELTELITEAQAGNLNFQQQTIKLLSLIIQAEQKLLVCMAGKSN